MIATKSFLIGFRFSRGTACRAPTEEGFGKPIKNSLPTVIHSFKSAVTKRVNETNNSPGASFWQRNYYERVIRNEKELKLIRQYMATNPLQWELDRENPQYKGKQDGDEITELLKRDFARARHASPLRVNHKEKS